MPNPVDSTPGNQLGNNRQVGGHARTDGHRINGTALVHLGTGLIGGGEHRVGQLRQRLGGLGGKNRCDSEHQSQKRHQPQRGFEDNCLRGVSVWFRPVAPRRVLLLRLLVGGVLIRSGFIVC